MPYKTKQWMKLVPLDPSEDGYKCKEGCPNHQCNGDCKNVEYGHGDLVRPNHYVVVLNEYERDNLLWLMNDIGRISELSALCTGDWNGQIPHKLSDDGWTTENPKYDNVPNCSFEELKRPLAERK
jgi:hypothetical protein